MMKLIAVAIVALALVGCDKTDNCNSNNWGKEATELIADGYLIPYYGPAKQLMK